MKKWLVISLLLTIPHVIEDVGLFFLGRYTSISAWIMVVCILGLGFGAGALMRLRRVRRFLGQ